MRQRAPMAVNGILNVNKPPACSSFSIVAAIRHTTGEKRVGHAGTLDPAATGVLPVCLGKATRVVEYLHDHPKEYVALIELGVSTDTYDADGMVTDRSDPAQIGTGQLQQALEPFLGTIDQIPPAYSALKVNGKKSYDLARAGVQLSPHPRTVTIEAIEVLSFENPYLKIRVRCSRGTYIRALANDVGQVLGCGAHLKHLVRTAYGPFRIEEAHSLEEILRLTEAGHLDSLLHPPDYPLQGWEKEDLDEDTGRKVIQGQDIHLGPPKPGEPAFRRAYCLGRFLGIIRFAPEKAVWRPEKVLDL
jgi:tRNA pseudouridine55 synthase